MSVLLTGAAIGAGVAAWLYVGAWLRRWRRGGRK